MAGMGDVKDKDKLVDHLIRQMKVNEEAKTDLPSMSSLLGQSPEEFYRNDSPEQSTRKAYNQIYNKANNYLDKFTPSLYKNTPMYPSEDVVHNLKRTSENLASGALNKDIVKSRDPQDFLEKLLEKNELSTSYQFHPPKEDVPILGEYSPEKDKLDLYVDEPGTIVHELGHAIDTKKGFTTEMHGEDPATVFKTKDKPKELEALLKSNNGSEIAKRLSGGHFSPDGFAQHAIDYPLQAYSEELETRGFDKEAPETNPKFDSLRNLMKTIRKNNK